MIRRGEIRWFQFAKPDKRRPVLILCRDELIGRLEQIPVLPISTQIRGLPSEVVLGLDDGLFTTCTLKPEWIRAVDKREVGPFIASLQTARWAEVERAVMYVQGF